MAQDGSITQKLSNNLPTYQILTLMIRDLPFQYFINKSNFLYDELAQSSDLEFLLLNPKHRNQSK